VLDDLTKIGKTAETIGRGVSLCPTVPPRPSSRWLFSSWVTAWVMLQIGSFLV
jgi:hypothetical protein